MYSVLLLNCSMYALVDSYQALNFKLGHPKLRYTVFQKYTQFCLFMM